MEIDWSQVEYFEPADFDDPDVPGSWEHMDPRTIRALDRLRQRTGWPIVPHNRFGVRGCVCVEPAGHAAKSRHYATHPDGCSAVDWHFVTDAHPRDQAMAVLQSGFGGIGIYYDWHWGRNPLPVGFHTDLRRRPQVWVRKGGQYTYLLQ